jgi:hypothetical protein
MKGKRLEYKILCMNREVVFILCNGHSLKLAVNDAAMLSADAVSFFGMVQRFEFFWVYLHIVGQR